MSDLRKAVQEYLRERRSLGFKLYGAGLLLSQFVRFLEERGATHITRELALQWATLPQDCHPAHWARRLGVVRQFAGYHSATDARTEIPPQGLLPYKYSRATPYIYTQEQVLALMEAARKLPSHTGLRPSTYSTLFGLLVVTGMRITETLGLDCADVDFREGVLSVRQTKLGKLRLIPMHLSTVRALRRYAHRRDRIYPEAKTPSFFVAEGGTRLTGWTVRWTFNRLSRQIGLRGASDRVGPRIHDFRHTFAVRLLQNWCRQNKDVEKRLPQLAMLLGHTHVNDTYWYLTATPDLLQSAAKRMASSRKEYR
jgi:integrase/recombinase XerD